MSINRVNISGNLTRDPELRMTSGGTQVLSFGVAVNDRRRNPQSGEWEDYPNFVDCTMFGARAEAVSRYLSKGSKVAIEGKLRYSSWERDGQRRSKLEVIVDEIEFMSRGSQQGDGGYSNAPQAPRGGYGPVIRHCRARAGLGLLADVDAVLRGVLEDKALELPLGGLRPARDDAEVVFLDLARGYLLVHDAQGLRPLFFGPQNGRAIGLEQKFHCFVPPFAVVQRWSPARPSRSKKIPPSGERSSPKRRRLQEKGRRKPALRACAPAAAPRPPQVVSTVTLTLFHGAPASFPGK